MNDDDIREQRAEALRRAMLAEKAMTTGDPHEIFKEIASSGVAKGWTQWGWFVAGWNASTMARHNCDNCRPEESM